MFFNYLPRKHLSRRMEAQEEEERILKKAAYQFNQPCLSDDVVIKSKKSRIESKPQMFINSHHFEPNYL